MTPTKAIEVLTDLVRMNTPINIMGVPIDAINTAIDALEEQTLDIKSLKRDLPELFRPDYDGGYKLEE